MRIITVTRKFHFCAGHRILGHQGKCRYLHGHNYVAEVTAAQEGPDNLDGLGMVVDFSVLKNKVGGWINDNWDHNLILHSRDPLAIIYSNMIAPFEPTESFRIGLADFPSEKIMGWVKDPFGRKPYIMPEESNPTAENMAMELATNVQLPSGIFIVKVELWEQEDSKATYFVQPHQR